MHVGVLVAGGVALLGALVAAIWLPARESDANLAGQAAEYADEHAARRPAVDLAAAEATDVDEAPAEI